MAEGDGNKKRGPVTVHLLMVFCAFLVSTSFTVGKAIADGLDPVLLTLVRFAMATCILTPYVAYYHTLRCSLSLFLRCSVISLSLVLFFWCMFLSLRYTTALNTSIIFTLVPSIAGFYAMLLVNERLTVGKIIALCCGMVGALWVIFRGDPAMLAEMAWNKGDLIFLAGCFAMGLYTPLVRFLHRGEPMVVVTLYVLVSGTVWLLLLAGNSIFTVDWIEVQPKVWAGVLYLAFFTTVISFFLTQYSIPHLGPTRVMAYSYLYPALVLGLDLTFGNEWPGGRVLPGIIVVLLAMVVIQRSGDGSR